MITLCNLSTEQVNQSFSEKNVKNQSNSELLLFCFSVLFFFRIVYFTMCLYIALAHLVIYLFYNYFT